MRGKGALAAAAVLLSSVCVVRALTGCIIADTPSDLPPIPQFRPTILHGSVVPPDNQVLRSFPDKFVVPVELVDPSATFEWRAFIDYDPATGVGFADNGFSSPDPGSADGGIRPLEIALQSPADLGRCHVIEVVVALSFASTVTEGRIGHTVGSTGGDNVVWFFAPSGEVQNCPTFDAGDDEGGDGGGSVQ